MSGQLIGPPMHSDPPENSALRKLPLSIMDMADCRDPSLEDVEPGPQLPLPLPFSSRSHTIDFEKLLEASSDAPLFSSDDLLSSSADNYAKPRPKPQRKRVWYEEPQDGNKKMRFGDGPAIHSKRTLTRNYDSGVFMSDSFEKEEEDEGEAKLAPYEKYSTQYPEDPGHFEGPVWPYWQQQPQDLKRYHDLQHRATAKVWSTIDRGDEKIDLSDLELDEVRAPTLRPLRYVTSSKFDAGSPTDVDLKPSLQIYLANNHLRALPSELYHLDTIGTLSVRGNKIEEILPGIGNLHNLKELNLSCNRLRYLPFELLELIRSSLAKDEVSTNNVSKFILSPNPFLRPMPHKWPDEFSPKSRPHRSKVSLRKYMEREPQDPLTYIASTRPSFLDIVGRSVCEHTPAPTAASSYTEVEYELGYESQGLPKVTNLPFQQQTRTPSLLELCLRTIYASPNTAQAPFLLPSTLSPRLNALLERTFTLKESGGQLCTICKTPFIVPRSEWVEWWSCNGSENAEWGNGGQIPFVRRGCSWECWQDWVDDKNLAVFKGWESAFEYRDPR